MENTVIKLIRDNQTKKIKMTDTNLAEYATLKPNLKTFNDTLTLLLCYFCWTLYRPSGKNC